MMAFCTMMRRPARPNGRPQRVRSHPMCLWCAVACSTSWREFQRDRRCFGHTTPRASRCRCPGLEQDGGWRSGGGERRGRGSINALTGFLSSAVTWPTSFAASLALLPTNWWLSRSELSLIFLADVLDRVCSCDSFIRLCRTAASSICCGRSSHLFPTRSRRRQCTCIRTGLWVRTRGIPHLECTSTVMYPSLTWSVLLDGLLY